MFGAEGDMRSAAAARDAIADVIWRLSVLGAKLAVVLRRENIVAVIAGTGVGIHERRALLIVPETTLARDLGELDAGDVLLKAFLDVGFDLHAADPPIRFG